MNGERHPNPPSVEVRPQDRGLHALAAVAVAVACLFLVSVAVAGIGANPANDPRLIDDPIEGFNYDYADHCDSDVPRGTRAMVRWIDRHVRGELWGIYRCERWGGGRTSVHSEGRAIDWHLDARIDRERRAAMDLIDTLLATDHRGNQAALARRMGVQGVIFNCKAWWSNPGGLERYGPCYRNGRRISIDRTQAHKDHVHLELNKPGSRKNTSFWQSPLRSE